MDVREVTVGADIAAPPERVWQVVSDIEVMPRFSTELIGVQWADGFSAPGLGAQFLGRNLVAGFDAFYLQRNEGLAHRWTADAQLGGQVALCRQA